ncbi:iron transporter [Bordetella genomosp. 13]|uniref:iron transporter n=1 Tax=Bordetella genomosp. 13 TaxID=463040 RepID=UPI0011A261A8|nr:iron transporter [Bordetella genomosp. 13]
MMKHGVALAMGLGLSFAVHAAEYPIGKPVQKGGMEIGAVYLQPIEMDPPGMMRAAKESDVHLEADIHATADNKSGFPEGEWVPYLTVKFELQKAGSANVIKGTFMPMVANDGPHYGDNVKLEGPGKYHLKYTILPPGADGMAHFGRHTDKETGVAAFAAAFDVEYDFVYAGTGKKGGY